ncbi:MAG: hypothetical protein JXA69_10075 [Phycisphaerae bacterium]|nr:hypothetical protein [Phycisphaerae bacterium]
MLTQRPTRNGRRMCWLLVGLAGWCVPAFGDVQEFTATVKSEVTEIHGGQPGDSDVATETFPAGSTSNLPLIAEAGFVHEDSAGTVIASGQAATVFSDPRNRPGASPEEFGLTAAAFSMDASLSHETLSHATETRTIVFTPLNVGLTPDSPIEARSWFFVDGLLVLWANEGFEDLSGVTSRVRLTVKLERPETGETTTVLEASIDLTGGENAAAILTTQGAVQSEKLVPLDLSGFVSGLGTLQAVLIPNIAIPYQYQVNVGEVFKLSATIESTAVNQPGGYGAGVTLGAPIETLAGLVGQVAGEDIGDGFLAVLQGALLLAATPVIPLLPPIEDIEIVPLPGAEELPAGVLALDAFLPGLCGTLGVEAIAGALLVTGLMCVGTRRRF